MKGPRLDEIETAAPAHDPIHDGSEPAYLSAGEVLDALRKQYAPLPWEPRYDPVSEVVSCILSQHTSDLNSERAFKQLMDVFGSFEEVARGDTGLIAQSINSGDSPPSKHPG